MLSDQIPPTEYLNFLLLKVIECSAEHAEQLIAKYSEITVQTHALRCIWLIQRGRVHTPPAWLTASLRGNWQPTAEMPDDLTPQVLTFRIDEQTFMQYVKEHRVEKEDAEIRSLQAHTGKTPVWAFFAKGGDNALLCPPFLHFPLPRVQT
jgi:hypothetical protein